MSGFSFITLGPISGTLNVRRSCEPRRFLTNRRVWEAEKRQKTCKTNQQAVWALLQMQICPTAWGSLGKRSWDLFAILVMYMNPLCPGLRAC